MHVCLIRYPYIFIEVTIPVENSSMAGKKEAKSAAPPATSEEGKAWLAKLACRANVNAAAIAEKYGVTFGEQDINALIKELNERTERLNAGHTDGVEAMLYAQAYALQSIFVNLSRRAASQEYLKQFGTYLGFALKAQAQCRATLETLAEVKNPKPPTFVRQQNVAYQQQVNNNDFEKQPHETPARTEKNINSTNELLEAQHGERLDSGATCTTGGIDPHLAAVERVHRRKDG